MSQLPVGLMGDQHAVRPADENLAMSDFCNNLTTK